MSKNPDLSRQHFLFDNDQTDQVWINASDIIRRISPDYDFSQLSAVFRDVVGLYHGQYPGYLKVSTLYHDLRHIMDVFMCALRLTHGAHLANMQMTDDEVTMVAIAALMHDIGYAQQIGDEAGTGAKYTKTHVARGIVFVRQYLAEKHWSESWVVPLECMMQCTDPALKPSEIPFPDERVRLMGMLVGTADLVGQMADRAYLEKLLLLYFEFKEAGMGDFKNSQDLLQRTRDFYKDTQRKLDVDLGNTYELLGKHFKDWFGAESNYYMDSIAQNIAFLSGVIQDADGADFQQLLKRRGIVEKAKIIEDAQ